LRALRLLVATKQPPQSNEFQMSQLSQSYDRKPVRQAR
jgi:hypothetical protein